ncbi:MAG: sulfite exporter TauE/SafE family protein [Alphaproteobacteria bacterium]|nr:MAG: sulfite exporter TauE/SafE family protein [Alphaproteobacteria bacterium]
MIDDPLFYAVAIPAVLLTGISKGGFAGGFGLLAVPAMALIIPPVQAAGIMLPILITMDIIGVWAYRKTWDRKNLFILIPGAFLGIVFGALTASYFEDAHVRLVIGIVAIAFVLDSFLGHHQGREVKTPSRPRGTFWGAIAGFTSFVAHAGSPPFQIYMLPQNPDKTLFVGTSVMFFTAVNLIKLPPYWALGMLAPGNLTTSLVLLPLAPLGIAIGYWAHQKIPHAPFFRLVYALVFVVGLKLIWDGLVSFI